jgi:hypothetical protein
MKKDDAKLLILAEFRRWRQLPENSNKSASGDNALFFFNYVSAHKPSLLQFRSAGDKWQVVHGWLRNAGQLSD